MRSSSSGAELDSSPLALDASLKELGTPASSEWKREANHRLAAHRARRGGRAGLQAALPGMEPRQEPSDKAATGSIADRVAARYAKAPTYSEMLAAEARNAARAAQAAAVAAGEARDAAQAILVGLDVDIDTGRNGAPADHRRDSHSTPPAMASAPSASQPELRPHLAIAEAENELDDEEPPAVIQTLPAKLLEFPRELVAARKARPRLAEGPLREEFDRDANQSQLRIFEVEAEAISTRPVLEPALPGWSSIRLDAAPHTAPALPRPRDSRSAAQRADDAVGHPQKSPAIGFDLPLQTASLEDRLMAGLVDAALIVAGFLVFVLVFAGCTAHPPVGKPAWIGAGIILLGLAAIYQLLFFNFGHDTPGMRYAKIALCTFDDENPTRRAMRRRLGALLLSVCPLGLGILWAFFDDDRLGWHDRISHTYQRSYR